MATRFQRQALWQSLIWCLYIVYIIFFIVFIYKGNILFYTAEHFYKFFEELVKNCVVSYCLIL